MAASWADKCIGVQRISDRILLHKLMIGKAVFTFLSVHSPQVNLPGGDREQFYDQLQYAVVKVPATEIPIQVCEWNSHVSAATGVFSDTHGGHGFSTHDMEVERVLEFAIDKGPQVYNTWSKKRNSRLVIYRYSCYSTQVDYIFHHKDFSSAVSNVTVIPDEKCFIHHHVVVYDLLTPCANKQFSP